MTRILERYEKLLMETVDFEILTFKTYPKNHLRAGGRLEKLQFWFFRVIHFRKEYHENCALKYDLSKRALGQECCSYETSKSLRNSINELHLEIALKGESQ